LRLDFKARCFNDKEVHILAEELTTVKNNIEFVKNLRKEIGDKLLAEQIICECRKLKGPVLIYNAPTEPKDTLYMAFQPKR